MSDRRPADRPSEKNANPMSPTSPSSPSDPSRREPRDTEHVRERSPEHRGGSKRPMTDDERVDEASEESFPASDPPSQP